MTDRLEELRDQMLLEKQARFNREAVAELMQEWSINLSENIQLMRRCKNLSEYEYWKRPKERDRAIVVAAAPELTDDELKLLEWFDGDIIVVNKNYRRLVDMHIAPDWVCLLDAHPISRQQFAWMAEDAPGHSSRTYLTKFFVASVAYPPTLRCILEATDAVYGFNPVENSGEGAVRLSKTWEWMNDKTEFEHGGSVGSLAVNLASHLHYKEVGLLGYSLCEKGNPRWTVEEAKAREIMYYPDYADDTKYTNNGFVTVPDHFLAYLTFILYTTKQSNWTTWYNLSDSPLLRHANEELTAVKQSTLKDFIGGKA